MKALALLGAAGAVTTTLAVLLPLSMMASSIGSQDTITLSGASSCTIDTSGLTMDELDDEQIRNAGVILSVGRGLGIPDRGLVVAIATSFQESGLHNLNYGDRDSLGLFQQRPSTGWGRPDQVTDPEYAARAFFGGPSSPTRNTGLLGVPGWQNMDVWEAAQSVQRSAFPTAYAKWEGLATQVVVKLADGDTTCEPLVAGDWSLPLEKGYVLTSGFGIRTHPISGLVKLHTGLDFAAPTGTPAHAAASGRVTFAGVASGYGNLVRIQHANGIETYYGHLSAISVTAGAQVNPGDLIGRVGSTGNSTGPHLHFEVRLRGTPTDPMPFLQEKGLKP